MKYAKKVMKSAGGLVIRIPSDIVKILNLTEEDYVDVDITKIDLKKAREPK